MLPLHLDFPEGCRIVQRRIRQNFLANALVEQAESCRATLSKGGERLSSRRRSLATLALRWADRRLRSRFLLHS
jgi:hypothetical protein